MAGIANFHGKKAAPFAKGGKRRRAKKVLLRAKAAKSLSVRTGVPIDLAFRFRHGWIPLHPGEEDKHIAAAGEGHTIRITHKDGTKAIYRRTSKHNKGGLAKYENTTGSAASLNAGQMAAHIRKMVARGSTVHHAFSKGASLSTPTTGDEIDLDWAAWNANRKKSGISRGEVKSFKRMVGAPGKGAGLGNRTVQALQARASKPGHYRAKAILAASQGDTAAAKKFQALHVARQSARLAAKQAPKPRVQQAVTPRPQVSSAPRPPVTSKPKQPVINPSRRVVARRAMRKIARMGVGSKPRLT